MKKRKLFKQIITWKLGILCLKCYALLRQSLH